MTDAAIPGDNGQLIEISYPGQRKKITNCPRHLWEYLWSRPDTQLPFVQPVGKFKLGRDGQGARPAQASGDARPRREVGMRIPAPYSKDRSFWNITDSAKRNRDS
jgi:hypothetical protein